MSESPPTIRPSATARGPFRTALWVVTIIGSIVMVLLGLAVIALGMLPSDAPGFFLLFGVQVVTGGALGLVHALTKGRGWFRMLLRLTSITVNSALVVRIAMLVLDGTVRGPIVVAAPLLLGLPAVLNVVTAGIGIGRANVKHACEQCGYDIRGLRVSRCPECGLSFHPPSESA